MTAEGELDHVLRTHLPWRRDEPLTECGLTGTPGLSHEQLAAKRERQGQQRAALTTCMTCWERTDSWGWRYHGRGLVAVLAREIERVRRSRKVEHEERLERELRAIEALVEAHRDEFDGYLAGLDATVDLTERRRNRSAQARWRRGAS